MKIKLSCICGASFELDGNFLNAKQLICPNCGKVFPEKSFSGVQSMLKGCKDLDEGFPEEECLHYEIELDSQFT